jgi:hypothetical protein
MPAPLGSTILRKGKRRMLENYGSSLPGHAVSCRVCHDPDVCVNVAMSAFFIITHIY